MGFELDLDPINLRIMYRRFTMLGYTPEEAGNLVAKLVGLDITKSGWKIEQIIHMVWLTKLTLVS